MEMKELFFMERNTEFSVHFYIHPPKGTWKFPCTFKQIRWKVTWKFPCTFTQITLKGKRKFLCTFLVNVQASTEVLKKDARK